MRRRFDGLASSVEVRQETITFEFDSVEGWLRFWERANPPQIALKSTLSPTAYQEMLAEAVGLVRELKRPGSDGVVLDSACVQVLALKADLPAA